MEGCPIQTLLVRFVTGEKGPFRGPFRLGHTVKKKIIPIKIVTVKLSELKPNLNRPDAEGKERSLFDLISDIRGGH